MKVWGPRVKKDVESCGTHSRSSAKELSFTTSLGVHRMCVQRLAWAVWEMVSQSLRVKA